jgi:hypothetical protein
MKFGDRHTFTIGRDHPATAAPLAALAAVSLKMVLTDRLHALADRVGKATVDPHTRQALTEARQALDLAGQARFRAEHPEVGR